jgi:hypothetical protein
MEKQEQEELNILTGKGYEFITPPFHGITNWNTGKITLGKMFRLSKVFIKMKVNEEEVQSQDLSIRMPAQYESVRENAMLCAMAIAISVEGVTREVLPKTLPKWTPKFLQKFIKKEIEIIPLEELQIHFLESFSTKELLEFTNAMLRNAEFQNFPISTVLMNGMRPTMAKPIEKTV